MAQLQPSAAPSARDRSLPRGKHSQQSSNPVQPPRRFRRGTSLETIFEADYYPNDVPEGYAEYLRAANINAYTTSRQIVDRMGCQLQLYSNLCHFTTMYSEFVIARGRHAELAFVNPSPLEVICGVLGDVRILRWLADAAPVPSLAEACRNPDVIQATCRYDRLEMLRFMIDRFALNVKDMIASQAIVSALYGRGREVVTYLIERFGCRVYKKFDRVLSNKDMTLLDSILARAVLNARTP